MDGRNWYGYCANSPQNKMDASGLLSLSGWQNERELTGEGLLGNAGASLGEMLAAIAEQIHSVCSQVAHAWEGDDMHDTNGNPVRVGGWPGWFNSNMNAMTLCGTVHVKNLVTYQQYLNSIHWEDHEEGHIRQQEGVPTPLWLIGYGQDAILGVITEVSGAAPSKCGPVGHDWNPTERDAEQYAYEKDGQWDFAGGPKT